MPSFPQLEKEIKVAIKALGGEVFPKLNWSSPVDAAWISHNGTVRCVTPGDIILLMKSSVGNIISLASACVILIVGGLWWWC